MVYCLGGPHCKGVLVAGGWLEHREFVDLLGRILTKFQFRSLSDKATVIIQGYLASSSFIIHTYTVQSPPHPSPLWPSHISHPTTTPPCPPPPITTPPKPLHKTPYTSPAETSPSSTHRPSLSRSFPSDPLPSSPHQRHDSIIRYWL